MTNAARREELVRPSYYIYGFKGDRLFTTIVHIDNEVGGIISRMTRDGWEMFSRRLRANSYCNKETR